MSTAYIGIGSNLGNRQKQIAMAIALLNAHPKIDAIAQSQWREYEALALDGEELPNYLNGVVEIHTELTPQELLDVCQSIERELGRPANHGKWQPRPIDLDVLLYDSVILETPSLTIPHSELAKRVFVLEPLCDIAPDLVAPGKDKNIRELLAEIRDER
jgi:2-amino-4-hydroxy-6-hydroxymethyldihydropteridine diphosphokinase